MSCFFSVPHEELVRWVQGCIEDNGAATFQNAGGISVKNFVSLLWLYLSAMVVKHDDRLYIQKKRNLYHFMRGDSAVNNFFTVFNKWLYDGVVQKIFSYIDDCFMCYKRGRVLVTNKVFAEVLKTSSYFGGGLKFTHEIKTGFQTLTSASRKTRVWDVLSPCDQRAPGLGISSLKSCKMCNCLDVLWVVYCKLLYPSHAN